MTAFCVDRLLKSFFGEISGYSERFFLRWIEANVSCKHTVL